MKISGLLKDKLYKLRYNLLLALNIFFGLVNYYLYIKMFGVSMEMDAFVVVSNVILAMSLITSFITEQFLFYYDKSKSINKKLADRFASSLILLVVFVNLLIIAAFFVFGGHLASLIVGAKRLDPKLVYLLLVLGCVQICFSQICGLLFLMLNSYGKIGTYYIIQVFQSLLISVFYVIALVTGMHHVEIITIAAVVAMLFTIIITIIYIFTKTDFTFYFTLELSKYKDYFKNGLIIRTGHNINNMAMPLITARYLTDAAQGQASEFSYGKKMSEILNQVLLGPSFLIYRNSLSKLWPVGDSKEILNQIKKFIRKLFSYFLPLSALSLLILYFLMPLVFPNMQSSNITGIILHYAMFLVWNIILYYEAPYVQVVIVSNNGLYLVIINTINILIIAIAIYILWGMCGSYAIVLSMIIGQVFNCIMYAFKAKKLLGDLNDLLSAS